MSWGCALLIWGRKGQMSRSQCIDYWNGFWHIIALPFHLPSWNFIHRLPMSWRCALLRWGSKGQMSRSQCIDTENDNLCIIAVPVYLSSWNFTWVKDVPYWFQCEKVKVKGHNELISEYVFMPPAWKVCRGHLVIESSVCLSLCLSVCP